MPYAQWVASTGNGLKVLGYGDTTVGKSMFGITFPSIAAIDSEAGLGEYEDHPNIIDIINTQSKEDVEDAVDEVKSNVKKYKTLLIDSETKIQDSLLVTAMTVEEKRARKNNRDIEDSNIAQRGYGRINIINKKLQNLKIELSSYGVNVVSIAQEKEIKQKQGENWVKVGVEPLIAKNSAYDYDIILRLYKKKVGKEFKFYAEVEKDRTGVCKLGQVIENPSYEIWKEYIESKKDLEINKIEMNKSIEKDIENTEAEDKNKNELILEMKALISEMDDSQKVKVTDVLKSYNLNLRNLDLTENKDLVKAVDEIKKIKEG